MDEKSAPSDSTSGKAMSKKSAAAEYSADNIQLLEGLQAVVNALSEMLKVEVHLDGKVHRQTYKIGKPDGPVAVIGATDLHGTTVTFKPDVTIFSETKFSFETLGKRMRELAFLNKGLKIS